MKTLEKQAEEYGESNSCFIDDQGSTNEDMLATAYVAGWRACREALAKRFTKMTEDPGYSKTDCRMLDHAATIALSFGEEEASDPSILL